MLASGNLDDLGGDRVETLHEEQLHAIEDNLDDIFGASDGLNFDNILLLNGLDGIFGLSQVREGSLELLVGEVSLDFDVSSLGLASLGDSVDLFGLDVGFLVLLVELLEKFVGGLGGGVELGVLFLEDDLHRLDILSGLSELVEASVNVLLFPINGLILGGVKLMIGLDEGEIGLGGDVHVATHLLEVLRADLIDHLVDLAHMDSQLLFHFRFRVNLDLRQELGRDRDEGLLGPGQEPIDGAAREHGGELLGTLSELGIDGGEGENHVEVVLDTVEEVLPEDSGRGVFTLLAHFLHVDGLALDGDEILVFLTEQTWDFTGGEHRVDSFKEGLRLHLGVGHQEADRATLRAGLLVKLFDIVEEGAQVIGLGEGDLEHEVTADGRGKSRERGLTRTTDTDEHSATSSGVDRAGESKQVVHGVVEDNEGHLLGRVLLVVDVELLNGNSLHVLVAGAGFVNEGSLFNDFTILVGDIFSHEVGELELSEDLRLLEVVELSELVLSGSVEDVLEGLLVRGADQLVNKRALALVAPQADHEQARILNILSVEATVDDLLVTLSDAGHTTEDSSELTNGEDVMELGGGGEQLARGGLPKLDGGLDDGLNHADDFLSVLLLGEKLGEDTTVDTLNGLGAGRRNVDGEEQPLDTVGHIVATVGGVVHGSKELQARDHLRVASLFLVEEVEAAEVDELTSDLKGNLIIPLVDLRHAEVIKEDDELLVLEGTVVLRVLLLDFGLDGLLEVVGEGVEREVNSLERVVLL
mmetsp:Transcript_6335/g.7523  ORF Transcript_6335/g.7523 Transcript_6335/m.7523 type:complete len:756 (+) Transcript_6335:4217-6484(+)